MSPLAIDDIELVVSEEGARKVTRGLPHTGFRFQGSEENPLGYACEFVPMSAPNVKDGIQQVVLAGYVFTWNGTSLKLRESIVLKQLGSPGVGGLPF